MTEPTPGREQITDLLAEQWEAIGLLVARRQVERIGSFADLPAPFDHADFLARLGRGRLHGLARAQGRADQHLELLGPVLVEPACHAARLLQSARSELTAVVGYAVHRFRMTPEQQVHVVRPGFEGAHHRMRRLQHDDGGLPRGRWGGPPHHGLPPHSSGSHSRSTRRRRRA